MGYDASIRGGTILSVDNMNVDWDFNIDSDLSWNPKISGGCHHGASSFFSTVDLPRLTVSPDRETNMSILVEGSILVATNSDFEGTRKIPFKSSELRQK